MSPPSSRTAILQGMLDMLILQTLAAEPMHGYAVAQQLRFHTSGKLQVPQGSLYPALHRLENGGFLKGEWQDSAVGRPLRSYRLTAKGRRRLEAEVDNWRDLSATIALVLGTT